MDQQNTVHRVIEHYNHVADQFATITDENFFNAYCERPAMFSLLNGINGKQVLDAGCGSGHYSEWLLSQGAKVTAIDVSERMLELTRIRLQDKIELYLVDLSKPLDMFMDGVFDVIVSPLVLDYVADWDAVFSEFYRILRPRGSLIFSVSHPFFGHFQDEFQGEYFSVKLVEEKWSKRWNKRRVPSYRRSLSEMTLALSNAGFLIDKIIEPRPIETSQHKFPEQYDQYADRPAFICFSAVKGPNPT